MKSKYFAIGDQVLLIQSTHPDSFTVPDGKEVDEAVYLSHLDKLAQKRVEHDDQESKRLNEHRDGKRKEAQSVYDEALKIGFSDSAASLLAQSVFPGWLTKDASDTQLTKLPAVGKVTAERLQQAGYVTFAQVSAMSLEEWLQFGAKAQYQKVIDAAKALT